jgi:hypothetical protein
VLIVLHIEKKQIESTYSIHKSDFISLLKW